MSSNRDNMVIIPRFLEPRDSRPRRRAKEARNLERAKRKRAAIMQRLKKARLVRRLQSARATRSTAAIRKAAGAGAKTATRLGAKAGSRLLGPVGVALLAMDAINAAGSTVRRAEGGVSGRLLEAMDQDAIYGRLDELATGAEQGRGSIEGNEDLLKIIGIEGRVNSQIGRLGAWFRERETARAIGSDLIEREPAFDHLGSIVDKVIEGSVSAIKTSADAAVNAIRSFLGKEEIHR